MKKYLRLLSLSLFFLVILQPYTYAAPDFSSPVLKKAYDQVIVRIDQKTSKIILDENAKKSILEREEKLGNILLGIDTAVKSHDKTKIKEQAKLFLALYRDTMTFVQGLEKWDAPVIHKNISKVSGESVMTGKSTDITYYSDSFEGGKTANGNPFSQSFFSAAACDIPFNTLLQVGKGNSSVIVKVNDRPNCSRYPNLTDLTSIAFGKLGKISSGKIAGVSNVLWTVSKSYIKKVLSIDAFKDLWITLDDNIANTYLKNETFHVTGKELLGKEYTLLYLKSPSGKDITLGMKKWADSRFEYDYPLEEIGTYQMVLASGLGFDTSTFLNISVLEDSVFTPKKLIAGTNKPEQLNKLQVERVELPDFTSLYLFRFASPDFHTMTLRSGDATFVYRGFSTIAVRGDTFKSLDTDTPASLVIESQSSSTPFSHDTYTVPVTIFDKTMTLVPGYREERNENITSTEENGNLVIRWSVAKGKNVKSDIVLTLPDGNVEKYAFDSAGIDTDGYLKRGKVFEKILPLKQTGLYHVEVNYADGFAAYNGPLIYGQILPVSPNDLDSTEKKIGASDSSIIATESLKFVNDIRKKSGKWALVIDNILNNLATIKANDMAKHNNLSHTDSNGDKISGTAKRNNIKIGGSVGENIAGGNIGFRVLLLGLANSGGHRANMLDLWTKMGVGYAVKDGQVYYAQVFGE